MRLARAIAACLGFLRPMIFHSQSSPASLRRRALEQVAQARAVHEQHIAIMARQQAAYEALATEFETMEGADAPLSDYLRTLDQRLQ